MLPETVETMKRQTGHINNVIKVINNITGIAPKFVVS
jgi:methyl-accepting chemotaxis protein